MASSDDSVTPAPEFLSCGICLQPYRQPKLLPCLHTFCQDCLHSYIPPESISVSCPSCRLQSILPCQGVTALRDNTFLAGLLESGSKTCVLCHRNSVGSRCTKCGISLCASCVSDHTESGPGKHSVVSMSDSDPVMASNGDMSVPPLPCSSHEGKLLELYCSVCETAVCELCTEGAHSSHSVQPLAQAGDEHHSMLSGLLSKAQAQIPAMQAAVDTVKDTAHTLKANRQQAHTQITELFDCLEKAIRQRRELLIGDLDSTFDRKHRTLSTQLGSLEKTCSNARSCCEMTENALKQGSDTELLLVRKEVTEKLTHISKQQVQALPEENAFLTFEPGELSRLLQCLTGLGTIHSNSAIASETVATGEALRHCCINQPAVINITTKDKNGELIKVGHSSFMAEIVSDGESHIPDIVDHRNGTYDVIYTARHVGIYKLRIYLYGQPIKGSPFRIKAYKDQESLEKSVQSKSQKSVALSQRGTKRPSSSRSHGSSRKSNPVEDDLVVRIGSKGRGKGEFTNPQGIYTAGGKIVIADSNNQCIQVYTTSGSFKLKFGSRGRQPGQLQRPTGVAVTVNGNFLVADYDNRWIGVYGPDGKFINKIGTGKLLGPKGLCVDHNGHIIVVDNRGSCVFIFQSNGKLLHKFGSRGNEEHQFAGPHFCAVNAQNDVIVTDFHNHCCKVFDSEGGFRFAFGSNGEGNGQFNAPTGVAVDSTGNILVADWGNSRIQVFDNRGSFLSYINTSADPLYGPQGLAITEEGSVVVADSGNHCFKIYKYLQ